MTTKKQLEMNKREWKARHCGDSFLGDVGLFDGFVMLPAYKLKNIHKAVNSLNARVKELEWITRTGEDI